MRKKPFLLMEILLAFTLVTLSIATLVGNSMLWTKNEFKKLERIEQERIADWTFTEIYEMLLKNEISWNTFPELKQTTAYFSLPNAIMHLPDGKTKQIRREYTLRTWGNKSGTKGQKYKQIYVNVIFNRNPNKKSSLFNLIKKDPPKKTDVYTYRVPLQKLPS